MPVRYLVKPGDCIASIAFAHGFFPDTVWSDPANEELRGKRSSPNVLGPGDVVQVPDLRQREVVCATGKVHRFQRRGVPEKLRIRLTVDGVARPALAYKLLIDGVERAGTTDADGWLDEWIPPAALDGTLVIEDDGNREEYELRLGTIAPIDTSDGLRSRLRALGFLGDRDSEAALRIATRRFQAAHGLSASGDVDDALRAKLVEVHGS